MSRIAPFSPRHQPEPSGSGHFIDFIRISQTHPLQMNDQGEFIKLPLVDSGVVYKFARDENGNFTYDDMGEPVPEYESLSRRFFEGSFDSLVIIRCDGSKVEFEGNVGRFCRPDNLFNFDFDATIQKVNEVLATYGLPPFTAGEVYEKSQPSKHDIINGLLLEWTGATISELHITRNYVTGNAGNGKAAIDWLATQSVARVKRGMSRETTVTWGAKSARKYLKAYLKADEMLVHRHGRTKAEIEQDPVYQYCQSHGILRFELEAKRLLLRDNHCRFLGEITMSKLIRLFENEVTPLLSRVKTDVTRMELEHLPAPVRMTASAFLRGENVRSLLSRATFFRHAKVLRDYGLDISEPLPTLHKFSPVINVIKIEPVETVPEWYWQHQRRMSLKAVGDYNDMPELLPSVEFQAFAQDTALITPFPTASRISTASPLDYGGIDAC